MNSRYYSRYQHHQHRGTYRGYQQNNFSQGNGCMFCTGVDEDEQSHIRRQCPIFRQLKSTISTKSYVDTELCNNDIQGFAAAGFLLWKRVNKDVELLMAREYRDGLDLLNFLGGKRIQKDEKPIQVALKKVDKESGRKLHRKTLQEMQKAPIVHWCSESKYALFLFEVTEWTDCEVDVICAGVQTKGVKRLEWISRADLKSPRFVQQELHNFSLEMVQDLQICNVLDKINELFDTVKIAAEEKPASKEEEVLFDFDVVKAILSSASTARGNVFESGKVCWSQIYDAVKVLHRQDIRKLKLRFHPDRLSRQLQRDPSELEKKTGTKAMQVLNQIFDNIENPSSAPSRSQYSGGVFDTIKELQDLMKKCNGNDLESTDDRVSAAVTAKLAEIKIK